MSTHQLQVNTSGAWKTVLHFDGGDKAKQDQVWQAVQTLEEASSSSQNWRIASCDRHPVVLAHMGPSTYGIWMLDTTSSAVSDDIVTALVKLLDGFAVEPIDTATSPTVAMAAWLTEQAAPAGFDIGKECELKAADESQACVRYTHHQLATEEVKAHIATGKQPTRLALDWDGRVSFVLTDSMQLKKVTFADSVLEQSKAQGQRADDFDGNVLMLTSEIGPLINDLVDALGGEHGSGNA